MEKFKVLWSVEDATDRSCFFSKVVESSVLKKRFKIRHSTGNCYSNTEIYVMLPDLSWAEVANEGDIGECVINYLKNESVKWNQMSKIYDRALEYITKVFC